MDKDKFLELQSLFQEHQACEKSLDQLATSKKFLIKESKAGLSLFKIGLGVFGAEMDEKKGVNVEKMKPVVLELIDRMTAYYQERKEEIDQIVKRS